MFGGQTYIFDYYSIAYTVRVLAQFMQSPRQEHYDDALHVVRFLKGNLR